MKNLILLVLLMVGLSSCTKQSLAKNWGGNATIEIPKNNIVLSSSWKNEDTLWILTKDTITNEVVYREFSPLGLIEGSITFKAKE